MRVFRLRVWCLVGVLACASSASAQPTLYHLHTELSPGSFILRHLGTAGPDTTAVTLQTGELKSQPAGVYQFGASTWVTPAGDPGAAGTLPSGATLTFTVYMNKTANWGTMFPRVRLNVADASPAMGAQICEGTGTTAITTTMTAYTVSCTLPAGITLAATDRHG